MSGDNALGFVDLPVNVRLLPVVHQAKRLLIPEGVSPPTLLNRDLQLLRWWIPFSRIYKELCVSVFSHTYKVVKINYPMSRIM